MRKGCCHGPHATNRKQRRAGGCGHSWCLDCFPSDRPQPPITRVRQADLADAKRARDKERQEERRRLP